MPQHHAQVFRALTPMAAVLLLCACVVVPQTREVYDAKCRTMTKEVVLETAVLGQFASCHGGDCAVLLATLGVVTAATAVVSGSVAVVGNVVYWFERQGRCLAAAPASSAPVFPPAGAASA
jgi:hypothetical protein